MDANDGSVIFEDLTNSTGVLVVAGPKARELMQKFQKMIFLMKILNG